MNRRRLVFTILMGTLATTLAASESHATNEEIDWQTDYAAAQKTRAAEQRPLLVFITMDGCHFCHRMLNETYSDQTIRTTISSHFLPTKINGTLNQDLAQRFGVRIFPTTFFIDADNLVVDRVEGYMAPEMFRQRVASATDSVVR